MLSTILFSNWPYFLFLYRVKNTMHISWWKVGKDTDLAKKYMHFYIKILCGQSWLLYFLSLYGKFFAGLGDGECIGFAPGYSTPSSDTLLKNTPFQPIFSRIALVFSGREWSLSRETSFTVWETLLWREKIHGFKRDKHSQSNRIRP